MIVLYISIFITVALTIVVYFNKTNKATRWKFESLSTLLQTIFVFITLGITIFTIYSGNKDSQKLFKNLEKFSNQFVKMDNSLDSLSLKLKLLPKHVENFAESIENLNEITKNQRNDFRENTSKLNKTIVGLSDNLVEYKENINYFNEQLNKVTQLTDTQLVVWKEQQRLLLDEFSRKPILKIKPKSTFINKDTIIINDLIIENKGDVEANINAIVIFLKNDSCNSFKGDKFFIRMSDYKGSLVYRLTPHSESEIKILTAGKKTIIPCQIKVRKDFLITIVYRIDYYSKYKSGSVEDFLMSK